MAIASEKSSLNRRLGTALIGGPIVLAVLCSQSFWPTFFLMLLIGLLAAKEAEGLAGTGGAIGTFLLCFVGISWSFHKSFVLPLWVVPVVAIVAGFGFLWAILRHRKYLASVLGGLYVASGLGSLVLLHATEVSGHALRFAPSLVLIPIMALWLGDTGAYFIGKAFGKRPLAPKISPKKTVEGAIANVVWCMLGAWAMATLVGVPFGVAMLCGAVSGVLGQAGDLLESAVKREVGVKDSGSILPGHGGMLDRIDSILLSAPAVCAILTFL